MDKWNAAVARLKDKSSTRKARELAWRLHKECGWEFVEDRNGVAYNVPVY